MEINESYVMAHSPSMLPRVNKNAPLDGSLAHYSDVTNRDRAQNANCFLFAGKMPIPIYSKCTPPTARQLNFSDS